MDKLMEILEDLRPDVDFKTETGLVTNSVLDSFDIVSLRGDIEDAFDIEVHPNDMLAENFNSAEAIWAMIQRLQNK